MTKPARTVDQFCQSLTQIKVNSPLSWVSTFSKKSWGWGATISLTALLVLFSHSFVSAQVTNSVTNAIAEPGNPSLEILSGLVNTLWMLLASLLVMTAYGGFGFWIAGFSRYKNVVNALTTNLVIFILTLFIFWIFGFAFLFGTQGNPIIGSGDWFLGASTPAMYGLKPFPDGIPLAVFFLFHSALAGITAMIVAGAIAERVKFLDFLIFTVLLVGIAYPLVGHWIWGGGWLSNLGFKDFAGSTVIHSVGGWAAFSGLAILGPRMGKYEKKRTHKLPGHSMSWATLGGLMMGFGWLGITGGSVFALTPQVPSIILVTLFAAVAAGFTALLAAWLLVKKADLTLILRGIIAGLVAVSGSCNTISIGSGIIIGAIAGLLAVLFIQWFDQVRIDDPVGVLSTHLIGGLWGTLAIGIFDRNAGLIRGQYLLLLNQLIGIAAVGVFMILFSGMIWLLLKGILGLRVGIEGEINGLDLSEHGVEAYSGFTLDSVNRLINPYEIAEAESAPEVSSPQSSEQQESQHQAEAGATLTADEEDDPTQATLIKNESLEPESTVPTTPNAE
ncbi:MAG: ammonium transporter [Snowella sp.]|nr:ammonium transporter [Snowella sp.]